MRAVSTSTQLQYSNWPISLSVIYANGYVAFDYLNIAPECVESMKEKKKNELHSIICWSNFESTCAIQSVCNGTAANQRQFVSRIKQFGENAASKINRHRLMKNPIQDFPLECICNWRMARFSFVLRCVRLVDLKKK